MLSDSIDSDLLGIDGVLDKYRIGNVLPYHTHLDILLPQPKNSRNLQKRKTTPNTPGGMASDSGTAGELEIDNIISNLNYRGASLQCYSPRENKLLVGVDGLILHPDRVVFGVPGKLPFYIERKCQTSPGSADHKYARDFLHMAFGYYKLPTMYVHTLEPSPLTSKGKIRTEKNKEGMRKRWNTITTTLDRWAIENDKGYYYGCYTLSEFKSLIT